MRVNVIVAVHLEAMPIVSVTAEPSLLLERRLREYRLVKAIITESW
jgi:hypothetical protein